MMMGMFLLRSVGAQTTVEPAKLGSVAFYTVPQEDLVALLRPFSGTTISYFVGFPALGDVSRISAEAEFRTGTPASVNFYLSVEGGLDQNCSASCPLNSTYDYCFTDFSQPFVLFDDNGGNFFVPPPECAMPANTNMTLVVEPVEIDGSFTQSVVGFILVAPTEPPTITFAPTPRPSSSFSPTGMPTPVPTSLPSPAPTPIPTGLVVVPTQVPTN